MTILRDDIPMWQTLRNFLIAGGSMNFPKVASFLRKYGHEHNENGVKALFRLARYEDGKWYSDANGGNKTNVGDPVAPGKPFMSAQTLVQTMENLGMVDKKPDPLDNCPF